jgi:hypothetical protein
MLTPPQVQLLEFLRSSMPTPAAKAFLKRTFEEFVLDYGWWYEPVELTAGIQRGTPNQCHKNASDLCGGDDSLIYCEGFALFKLGGQPTIHAWVTDGHGRAIDNTWPRPGVAYAGVPFKELFVTMTALKNHATVSLLDDYQNDYPLRGEQGDRPDDWLEPGGQGVSKLS